MTDELQKLLDKVRDYKMSPQEIWDQRVSFAYGNCAFKDYHITKDMIIEAATKIYGPRPESS